MKEKEVWHWEDRVGFRKLDPHAKRSLKTASKHAKIALEQSFVSLFPKEAKIALARCWPKLNNTGEVQHDFAQVHKLAEGSCDSSSRVQGDGESAGLDKASHNIPPECSESDEMPLAQRCANIEYEIETLAFADDVPLAYLEYPKTQSSSQHQCPEPSKCPNLVPNTKVVSGNGTQGVGKFSCWLKGTSVLPRGSKVQSSCRQQSPYQCDGEPDIPNRVTLKEKESHDEGNDPWWLKGNLLKGTLPPSLSKDSLHKDLFSSPQGPLSQGLDSEQGPVSTYWEWASGEPRETSPNVPRQTKLEEYPTSLPGKAAPVRQTGKERPGRTVRCKLHTRPDIRSSLVFPRQMEGVMPSRERRLAEKAEVECRQKWHKRMDVVLRNGNTCPEDLKDWSTFRKTKQMEYISENPRKVFFSRPCIDDCFSCGRTLASTIADLQSGAISVHDIPRITVVQRHGKLLTLDHRRLYCFKVALPPDAVVPMKLLKSEWLAETYANQDCKCYHGVRVEKVQHASGPAT